MKALLVRFGLLAGTSYWSLLFNDTRGFDIDMQYCDEERIKRRFEFISNTNLSART